MHVQVTALTSRAASGGSRAKQQMMAIAQALTLRASTTALECISGLEVGGICHPLSTGRGEEPLVINHLWLIVFCADEAVGAHIDEDRRVVWVATDVAADDDVVSHGPLIEQVAIGRQDLEVGVVRQTDEAFCEIESVDFARIGTISIGPIADIDAHVAS